MNWDDRIGRRLKLKDLHTLQTIAEVGSMAKASQRLSLSQPAISKAIAEMELVLGAALLERSSRGAELTESGRLLVERARVIFDELRQGVSDIEQRSDATRGAIRIGSTEPVVGVVAEVISRLARKYPRLTHDVIVSDLDTLLVQLRERSLDVLMSRWLPPLAADDLAVETMFNSSLGVVAAEGHPLLARKKLVLADLSEEQWTLSPPDSFLGRIIAGMFHSRDLPLPPTLVTTISVHLRLNLVATGRFLTVLPLQMLQYPSNKAWLRVLDIDLHDSVQPIASIALKRRRSASLGLFEQEAREVSKIMSLTRDRESTAPD
ncbi:MAG TPA: LysR family transcriptional regulator [Sphingomicrobium sp.]